MNFVPREWPLSASLLLAGHLMFPHPGFRPAQSAVEENKLGQEALWGLGVSGDWPILLATVESPVGMPSVRQLLRTHHYWRLKGITCDLVILNMHPFTYMQELSEIVWIGLTPFVLVIAINGSYRS